jgi:hypothetical protein
MAMVRATLAGKDEEAQRLFQEELAATGDASGMAMLVYAAFVIAARRKFAPTYNRGQVIRYVAGARALLNEKPWLLDALAGEDELRIALGEHVTITHPIAAVGLAQLSLLHVLIADLNLDDQGVQALLDEARPAADQMLQDLRPAGEESPETR